MRIFASLYSYLRDIISSKSDADVESLISTDDAIETPRY